MEIKMKYKQTLKSLGFKKESDGEISKFKKIIRGHEIYAYENEYGILLIKKVAKYRVYGKYFQKRTKTKLNNFIVKDIPENDNN